MFCQTSCHYSDSAFVPFAGDPLFPAVRLYFTDGTLQGNLPDVFFAPDSSGIPSILGGDIGRDGGVVLHNLFLKFDMGAQT